MLWWRALRARGVLTRVYLAGHTCGRPVADWGILRRYAAAPGPAADVVIGWRDAAPLACAPPGALTMLYTGDRATPNLDALTDGCDLVFVGSPAAYDRYSRQLRPRRGWLVDSCGHTLPGTAQVPRRRWRCVHASAPYRGLAPLLQLWPQIHQALPDVELLVLGGYQLWGYRERIARDLALREVPTLADPPPGVRYLGPLRAATTAGAALAFGPRYPGRLTGLGARVRAAETARSRKLRAVAAPGPVTAPQMLVAGGNMIVSLRAARRLGNTDPAFAAGAFEDVDLQLRAQAAEETVEYWPGLAVDHHDTLTAWQLLRKSTLSGTGMAACAARHGDAFWRCSRWRPARLLARRLAPALAAALCVTALPPARHLPILAAAGLMAIAAAARAPARRRLAVPALRTLRDVVLALSYLAGRARLAAASR